MRTQQVTTLIASGALVVTAGGIIAAVTIDEDDDRGSVTAEPTVSIMPSATLMTPDPTDAATAPVTTPPTGTSGPDPETSATTPSSDPTSPSDTTAPPATPETPALPMDRPRTYTVVSGDTLSEIAEWFELMGFRGLYEANREVIGSNPDLIFPGQVFIITETGQVRMKYLVPPVSN